MEVGTKKYIITTFVQIFVMLIFGTINSFNLSNMGLDVKTHRIVEIGGSMNLCEK